MLAGSSSSCGATAFSGTRQLQRHGNKFKLPAVLKSKHAVVSSSPRRSSRLCCNAIGGGGKPDDKKTLSREEEPEQFWQTKTEAKGENPIKDPLALIGLASILLPFIILGIAIATGVVDTSAGSQYGTGKP